MSLHLWEAVHDAERRSQFAELRVDFKQEINDAIGSQARTLVIGLISAVFLITVTNVLAFLVG